MLTLLVSDVYFSGRTFSHLVNNKVFCKTRCNPVLCTEIVGLHKRISNRRLPIYVDCEMLAVDHFMLIVNPPPPVINHRHKVLTVDCQSS